MNITKQVDKHGTIRYYNKNGKFHREDGPAIEYPIGRKYWYLNGKFHREDGPAIEYENGDKFWCINDKEYSEQEFNEFLLKKRLQRILEL